MTQKFYFLSLLVGLVCGMCFTSCCDTDDVTPIVPGGGGGEEVTLYLDNEALPAGIIDPTTGTIQLAEGGELTLPFVVEPAELASQIVLTSSDPSIVVVEGMKLNALKAGRVTITAKVGETETSFVVVVQKFVDRDENGNLKISEINFPDENFRTYVKDNFDTNSDDVLTDAEIAAVTQIIFSYKEAISIEGVDFFTALTSLDCSYNKLTSLDVSKNTELQSLSCNNNQLTSLDLSKNTALTSLYCNDNQLTSLDVTKNTALEYLDCKNNQLTSLDVSGCTALTYLYCQSNKLTSFDVSKNTALTVLYCYENQLTSLDVSKNTALTVLDCSSNQLTSLDVSKNTALKELYCSDNQITSLDLSNNTAMDSWGLYCDENVVVTWPEDN